METRKCRYCGCSEVTRVRESAAQHGLHQYSMTWFQCAKCSDVSFAYDRSHMSSSETAKIAVDMATDDREIAAHRSADEVVLTL